MYEYTDLISYQLYLINWPSYILTNTNVKYNRVIFIL